MSAGSSQPAERAVGAVPVDHPQGSTSPTPLPSGSAAAGAHRPDKDSSVAPTFVAALILAAALAGVLAALTIGAWIYG